MAPEQMGRIFESFIQDERKLHDAVGGLGIGLALVKSLSEPHGGFVAAFSAGPGQGSTFTMRLPLAAAPESLPAQPLSVQTPDAADTLPDQLVPELDRTRAHPILVLAILCGSLLIVYALQRAAFDYYAGPLQLLACLATGLVTGALVIRHQLRQKRPLLQLRKLLQPRYLAGLALFAFCYVILGANNTMLPALLQRALGAPLIAIGAVQTAGLLSAVLAFVVMLAVLRKYPAPRKFYVVGFAFLTWFALQLLRRNTGAELLSDVVPAIACFGVFLILVLATTAIHTFTGLQTDAIGFNHGQMIKNMMSQVGIALGMAGATLSLHWRIAEHATVLARRFANGDTVFTALRDQLASQGGAQMATAQLGQMVSQQAVLLASVDIFRC